MPANITTEVHDSTTGTVLTVNGTLTYFEVEDDGFTKLDAAPVDAGNYAVLFQVAETDEHAAASATAPYDIYRAVPAPQVTPLPDLALTDTLKLGDQQLPVDDKGTWTWVAPETALTATGGYRFLARYTPNDTRNYISVVDWWTFNVVDAVNRTPIPPRTRRPIRRQTLRIPVAAIAPPRPPRPRQPLRPRSPTRRPHTCHRRKSRNRRGYHRCSRVDAHQTSRIAQRKHPRGRHGHTAVRPRFAP